MTTETPGNQSTFRGVALVRPLLFTGVVGVGAAVAGGLVAGSPSAVGAAIGGVMVCVFFALGAAVLGVIARLAPELSLLIAMLTYVLTVALVGLVFVALTRSGALERAVDPGWLGGTVIGCTLVWLTVQIVATTRARLPIYELPAHEEADAR